MSSSPVRPACRSGLSTPASVGVGYWLLSFPFFAWVAFGRSPHQLRRYLGLVGDIGFLSLALYFDDLHVAPLFLMYLWVPIGNGFRYGLGSLMAGVALGAVLFVVVIVENPAWRAQPHVAWGLLATILIVPAYCAALLRQVARARRQAEQANNAKDRLLAKVSHELRTPLTTIQAGLNLLDQLPPARTDIVRPMHDAVRTLTVLVADLLEAGRLAADAYELRPIRFDLFELLLSVARNARQSCLERDLDFRLRISYDVPRHLFTDPTRLRQMIENMLANALKFSDVGLIELVASIRDQRLCLQVLDRGIGISSTDAASAFDVFRQGEAARKRGSGAGLGLAIVRQLVTMMGGEAGLESRPAGGVNAWIELPVAADAAPQFGGPAAEIARVDSRNQAEPVLRWIEAANSGAEGPFAIAVGGGESPLLLATPFALLRLHDDPITTRLDEKAFVSIHVPVERTSFLRGVVVARILLQLEKAKRRVVSLGRYDGNLLLVDDNDVNRALVARLLQATGCRLTQAANAKRRCGWFRPTPSISF